MRLELTENVVLDHAETVLQTLSRLRALGVQLHIDDFGTGYSSLSYLQRFPYDTVKIDRSFISSPRSRAGVSPIVSTIISLCDHLKMNVIAEGVETAEQARQLREVRCPQAQGYWFARPLGTADAEAMLAAQRVS
ncbi:MAG TPA: EAL domain-containing protein [Thermoanaerobaculia bacterium]